MTRTCAFLVVLAVLTAAPAYAQAPADGPPSAGLQAALRAYQAERFAEALPLFEASASGRQPEAPAQQQRAQVFAGRTLVFLQRWTEALAVFAVIARAGSGHNYFHAAFPRLVELHERVPLASEPTLIEAIGHYEEREIGTFDRSDRERIATAYYLMGRARHAAGRYVEALSLFRRVPDGARVTSAAREWHRRTLAAVGPQ